MPSPTQNQPPLEERLRRAVKSAELKPEYRQGLRRALLNSPYFDQPPLSRWLQRVWRSWPLASGALGLGFLAAVGLAAKPPTPASNAAAPPALTVVNPASLERLGRSGHLLEVTSAPNAGIRVYRVQLASGEILELIDRAPYALRLTNQP